MKNVINGMQIIDISAMQKFIDIYEDLEKEYQRYQAYIKSLSEIMNITQEKEVEIQIEDERIKTLNKLGKDKQETEKLKIKLQKLEETKQQLEKFSGIINLYKIFSKENAMQEFYQPIDKQELRRQIKMQYPEYDDASIEYQLKIEMDKYNKQEKNTITEIYIDLKQICKIKEEIEKNKKIKLKLLSKLLLKRKLKKLNFDSSKLVLYQRYMPLVQKFNSKYQEKIETEKIKAEELPKIIRISDDITIETNEIKEENNSTNYKEPEIIEYEYVENDKTEENLTKRQKNINMLLELKEEAENLQNNYQKKI